MSNSVMIVVMSGHPGETETHEAFMILRAILKHGPECQPTDFQINNFTALSGNRSIIHTPSSLTPCEINYLEICNYLLFKKNKECQ